MPCSKSDGNRSASRNPLHHLSHSGSAVQVIAHKQTVKVPVVDFMPERAACACATVGYQGSPSTLDLALGPYCEPPLLQVEKESHVLLVTMHHIVSDGWDGILES